MADQHVVALVVAVAPSPATFRAMQLSSARLRLASDQQFRARKAFRQYIIGPEYAGSYEIRCWTLPSGRDGPFMIFYNYGSWSPVTCGYYINDRVYKSPHGTIFWGCDGHMIRTL